MNNPAGVLDSQEKYGDVEQMHEKTLELLDVWCCMFYKMCPTLVPHWTSGIWERCHAMQHNIVTQGPQQFIYVSNAYKLKSYRRWVRGAGPGESLHT